MILSYFQIYNVAGYTGWFSNKETRDIQGGKKIKQDK